MKFYRYVLIFLFGFIADGVWAQRTVSGTITDAGSGETIIGATIIPKGGNRGTSSNLYGFYSLTLPAKQHEISFSFIGYKTQTISCDLTKSLTLNVQLEPAVVEFDEVTVIGNRSEHTKGTDLGRESVEVEQIKALPALLGEVDVLKVLQFLPGVSSAGEGNSGFYVRGGGPDQNLILLDDATIYNASHLFGFFSVFNADAIKHIDLIKGAMPAEYGGRVSSVLNIALKEGNSKKWTTSGGLGLISSRLTIEGPLVEDKSSLILSGRRTYIDVLTRPALKGSAFEGTGYYFYDLNAKVNYRLSEKDQVFLSGYFGEDVFSFNSDEAGFRTELPWGNTMASLRWNHIINDRMFLNVGTTYSEYNFSFIAGQEDFEFGFESGIKDWAGRTEWSFYPNLQHSIKGGIDYVRHDFVPTDFMARSGDTEFDTGTSEQTFSHESGIYLQDDFDINEIIRLHAGLRWSSFWHVGPFTRYPQNSVGITPQVITVYEPGELVQFYGGWEPRLALRVISGPNSSIKAGYSENYQYIHLTSLGTSSLPGDIWIPSSDRVKPQWGRQLSLGYFRDLGPTQSWEASIEGYYKDLENLVAYAENSRPEDNIGNNVDNNLVFGQGWSYGVETFIKRSQGKLTGWVGYTWSKTERQFDDLNQGLVFPSKYDRRHDLSVVLDWKINAKWRLSGAFVYATGNSLTLPVQRYLFEGRITDVFGSRNGYRMAPYHRADISATLTPDKKRNNNETKTNRVSTWNFGVYNAYNRMNPYFIYFSNEGDLNSGTLDLKANQVSLFPIIPSVTWNFNF
ncbi:MAG: carboxypeptidase-like regulatory domain-containing protein [Bacteroidetes bacterium]|nr:carboxypeptidase-like regulatory domain-containing protein [Bacteroidota bacterium]MDA1335674.1 carboxypeptidase-like regulatory domain-containing protein [Bacteroidota bacterium]